MDHNCKNHGNYIFEILTVPGTTPSHQERSTDTMQRPLVLVVKELKLNYNPSTTDH
jgi:hypothetical protein